MNFHVIDYIVFLDSVIAECGHVSCLSPGSNAVTRRAKASYLLERESLLNLVSRVAVTEFSWDFYGECWSDLCKHKKYGVLSDRYAQPKTPHDLRYPRDGRCVPGYAKDVLAQLRTLTKCVIAAGKEKTGKASATK